MFEWLIAGTLAGADASAPTRPARVRWEVNHSEAYCTVARQPPGENGIAVLIRYGALGFGGDVIFASPSLSGQSARDSIVVVVDGVAGRPLRSTFTEPAVGPARLQTEWRYGEDLTRIVSGRHIVVRQGGRDAFATDYAEPSGVKAALDECRREALGRTGIDAGLAQANTPVGNPGAWLVAEYPAAARRDGAEGRVGVLLIIQSNGRVRRCVIGHSSGRQDLDDATCSSVMKSGRYQPFDGPDLLARLMFSWSLN